MRLAPTYAELFAGAGGLSIGLERAGFKCRWHAELADFPTRILSYRWDGTPLYGDVTQLNGLELIERHGRIDVLSGGSPCQDLSVAGKRAGLDGARSGLFYEQMRLWDETQAPLCLWENVEGARSSNSGEDLGRVLSAFVGATVTVPADGWGSSCVVAGSTGVAAMRILDAQFFGVAQRRRRIFILGSRATSIDPSEVLLECESLLRHSAPSRRPTNNAPRSPRAGTQDESRGHLAFSAKDDGCDATLNLSPTLRSSPGQKQNGGTMPAVIPIDMRNATRTTDKSAQNRQGSGIGDIGDVSPMLTGELESFVPAVIAFDEAQVTHPENRSNPQAGDPAPTFADPSRIILAQAFKASHYTRGKDGAPSETVPPLTADADKGDQDVLIIAPTLAPGAHPGGLNGNDFLQVAAVIEAEVIGALNSRSRLDRGDTSDNHKLNLLGVPRRLLPVECERLMGWDDGWTDVPDEKGKPAADGPRYKAIGNGVASPVVQWIGLRLYPYLTKE